MSQTGQDRPSVLRAARERTRAEITRQILDVARRHLGTDGASGLSLRAIARELGASSSAVYRYVASRDELLTMLIVAAYALGAAAEAQEAAVARGDLAGRWSATCDAVRGWALANPNEYAQTLGLRIGRPYLEFSGQASRRRSSSSTRWQ
jgi:AcrR family transcriptional regulator